MLVTVPIAAEHGSFSHIYLLLAICIPSDTCFHGPKHVCPSGISVGSAIFIGLTHVKETDTCTHVAIAHIWYCLQCWWCRLKTENGGHDGVYEYLYICVWCVLQLQKGETEGYHKEMEELRRKNVNLAKEVERLTMQAEKPLEHQPVSVSFTLQWWVVALMFIMECHSLN